MIKLALPNNFRCSEAILPHLEKITQGEYETPLFGNSYTILDCGANVGAFAIWASHRWPGSTIYCYEPHPKTFENLEFNTRNYPNIKLYPEGLGNPGWRPLYNGAHNEGEASLYPNAISDGTGQHVEIISPLEMPEADIIKIDCESAEIEILEPLLVAGRRWKAVLVEFHHETFRRKIDELLNDYLLFRCDIHALTPHIGTAIYVHREVAVV